MLQVRLWGGGGEAKREREGGGGKEAGRERLVINSLLRIIIHVWCRDAYVLAWYGHLGSERGCRFLNERNGKEYQSPPLKLIIPLKV